MENEEKIDEPKTQPLVKAKRNLALKSVIAVLAVLLFLSLFTTKLDFIKGCETGQAVVGDFGSVDVDFYVMSQCPYGTEVVDAIAPVLKALGNSVNFNLDFVLYPKEAYAGSEDTYCVEELCSMHGVPEVKGNIVQLCAMKHEPEKAMDMITCMNKDAYSIPDNWEDCADGLDIEAIKSCYEGDEGIELLRESAARAEEAGAMGSPTIFVNGQPYAGGRDSMSFQREFCKHLQGHPECADMPECSEDFDCTAEPDKIGTCNSGECTYNDPVEFEVIVLSSDACGECQELATELVATTESLFIGAQPRYVDVKSEEGEQLVEELGLKFVPALLFAPEVKDTYMWGVNVQLATAFEDKGAWVKLLDEASGASHWIDEAARKAEEEARAAKLQELGIDLTDDRPQMDFFVMSYCPYGNIAEEAIAPVYEVLKEDADFNPRYVWYSNYNGGGPSFCIDDESIYCSMHGVQEASQNVRELCVAKHYGMDEWFEFAMAMNTQCSYNNADSCWQAVAENLGLDTEKISNCEENEWLELVEPDKKLGDALGIAGSPQVFIEGAEFSGSRLPSAYQAAICAAFDEQPDACSEILDDGETEDVTGSC